MANTDLKKSFKVIDPDRFRVDEFPVAASYAGQSGDACSLDSAGRITATMGVSAGIQSGNPRDVSAGGGAAVDTPGGSTCSAGDLIQMYFEPSVIFGGQISTGALTDKYTTRSSAACFDLAGSAGAQYINAAAHTGDFFKVIKPWVEYASGLESVVGVYQKVMAKFNGLIHFLGTTA